MNIEKIYFNIEIGSDCFCIFESTSKSKTDNSALVLLEKIKNIVEKNLKYNDQCNDKYSNLPKPILLQCLKEIATKVFTGYKEKVAQASWIVSRFGLNEKFETLYSRIHYCIPALPLAPALPFLKELIPQIVRHLSISDLGIFAQVNRSAKAHALDAMVPRAEEYGYEGDKPFEATKYLIKLFEEISRENSIFTAKYYPSAPFSERPQPPLKTLANLKNIDAKDFFTIILHDRMIEQKEFTTYTQNSYTGEYIFKTTKKFYVNKIYRFLLKRLKELPKEEVLREIDRRNESDDTALLGAAWRNDKEMVKLLLEYGANSRICNLKGCSAIHIARKYKFTEIVELLTKHAAAEPDAP